MAARALSLRTLSFTTRIVASRLPSRRNMASAQPQNRQFPPPPGTIVLGVERITQLLARLKDPHTRFPVIHVAGTNAKGSTTAYLDTLLYHTVGLRTGRFNSPHLVTERDTCSLNAGNDIIPADVWQEASSLVRTADQQAARLDCSPFELLTATAFQAFDLLGPALRPEILIIEVGLGGTLDATNVFPARNVLASVICPVDLDHESLLGSTLQEIATAKAGIVKPGGLCILADQRRPEQGLGGATAAPSLSTLEQDDAALVASSAVASIEAESSVLGPSAAVISNTVASTCIRPGGSRTETQRPDAFSSARIVRAWAPLHALSTPEQKKSASDGGASWQPRIQTRLVMTPTLCTPTAAINRYDDEDDFADGGLGHAVKSALATLHNVSFVPDPAIHPEAYEDDDDDMDVEQESSTPTGAVSRLLSQSYSYNLCLTATRAALSAASTALTTLHAVARDLPTLTRGSAQRDIHSRDPWEDLRLRIAYGLTASIAETDVPGERVRRAIEDGVRWRGRCEWVAIAAEDEGEYKLDPVLLDGAHNPASASALRSYLDACIWTRLSSIIEADGTSGPPAIEVTWIMSFSKGKDVQGMLERLLYNTSTSETALEQTLAGLSLHHAPDEQAHNPNITQRIGLCPFATPVEGMPWVQPTDPNEVAEVVQALFGSSGAHAAGGQGAGPEVRVFETLEETLRWAALPTSGEALKVTVICGSLYLVGECYSLAERVEGGRWTITPL